MSVNKLLVDHIPRPTQRHMSLSEERIPLIRMKVEEDALPSFPPEDFYQSVADGKLARSQECCFVLYCMSKVHLNLEMGDDNCQSFALFKDRFNKSRSSGNRPLLQRYFGIKDAQRPIDQDLEDAWDGTTVLSVKVEDHGNARALSEMSIYPKIMLFGKSNEFLDTKRHIKAYQQRFQLVLEKYNTGKLSHLYANWLKLIESYVEFVLRDLTIKWCQWLHSIRAVGQRHSVRTSLDRLLPKMTGQFWKRYFLFQHSLRRSIGSFSSMLSRRAFAMTKDIHEESRSTVSFGMWLDSLNGIMIFANGTAARNDDVYDTTVSPAYGICLDQVPPHIATKKLLLFLNFAIVASFMDEIR